jgi:hypothetical protein
MLTSNEIRSHIKNMRFYASKIEELARKQFELDMQLKNINYEVGSTRFDCIGAMGAACKWISIYCDNLESNLRHAEEQEFMLQKEVEEIL